MTQENDFGTIQTGGDGFWSKEIRDVKITDIEIGISEVRAYFDTSTWDVNIHGLIYTDKKFLTEFQKKLNVKIAYSEQGMQGDNYVSFDLIEISKLTHVDTFIDDHLDGDDDTKYARWFFALKRFPAALQVDFAEFISKYKLFCTYEGKRYRVTGCSRFGDVWLTSNFDAEFGYELRVDVAKCSDWAK